MGFLGEIEWKGSENTYVNKIRLFTVISINDSDKIKQCEI